MEDEYIVKEKNEEIKGENMLQRLSMYTQILSKENNISISFKNKSKIQLKEAKSFIKICSLNELYPEENIYFNYYLPGSQPETPKKNPSSHPLRSKPPKKKLEDKKLLKEGEEESNSLTIITSEIKESIQEDLKNEGSLIAKNPTIFKVIWISLYFLLFILPFIVLIGLCLPMTNEDKELDYYHIPRFLLMILNFYTSVCGCEKIGTNKKEVNFKKENILLISIILCGILGLVISFIDNDVFLYLFSSLTTEILILGLIIFVSILLFALNSNMIDFYKKYQEKIKSGTLLVDIK